MSDAIPMPFDPAGQRRPTDELEELLGLYAARRLAPRYGAMSRIRATLIAHVQGRGADSGGFLTAGRARSGRRLVMLGLAASLALGSAAAVLAAGPDSPLYGARLWVEAMTTPVLVDARDEAHRERLEARLEEAQGAAADGDAASIALALAAYRAEVEAALADLGDDATRLARLEAALGTHLVVLEALVDHVPAQAQPAIEAAREASDRAVAKIKEKKTKAGGPDSSPRQTRP
jgi:hypothetical protein